jgi:thiazole/oxazole-forming peptide maturase SagC family component
VAPDDLAWLALTDGNASWIDDGLLFEEKLLVFERWRNAVLVFASRIINPVQLRLLNRICLAHRIPWLHAAIDGPFLFVGPIFVPHRSACYECLETRIMMNLRESASYQRYKLAIADRQVRFGQLPLEPVTCGILSSHASLEAMNYVLTGSSSTVSKMLAIYLPTMEFTYNEVLKLPGCRGCSPYPERDDQQLYFDMGVLIS